MLNEPTGNGSPGGPVEASETIKDSHQKDRPPRTGSQRGLSGPTGSMAPDVAIANGPLNSLNLVGPGGVRAPGLVITPNFNVRWYVVRVVLQ